MSELQQMNQATASLAKGPRRLARVGAVVRLGLADRSSTYLCARSVDVAMVFSEADLPHGLPVCVMHPPCDGGRVFVPTDRTFLAVGSHLASRVAFDAFKCGERTAPLES